ncbi:hypothetical protein M422DRAFT_116029, partial [Sphaerobolus stellatus SS14]
RFNPGKFQLVHFTKVAHKYQALPINFNGTVVEASETAKYLGLVMDQKLKWKEQVEKARRKVEATGLVVGRLARPTFSMLHSMVVRLYYAAVFPRMAYALEVWYRPVLDTEGSGSVGFAALLGKVQRMMTRTITGGFKSTATDTLEYHAHLAPIHLKLNQ